MGSYGNLHDKVLEQTRSDFRNNPVKSFALKQSMHQLEDLQLGLYGLNFGHF
jgi:hypothetical protein